MLFLSIVSTYFYFIKLHETILLHCSRDNQTTVDTHYNY